VTGVHFWHYVLKRFRSTLKNLAPLHSWFCGKVVDSSGSVVSAKEANSYMPLFQKRPEDESYHVLCSSSICNILRFLVCTTALLYPPYPPTTPIPPSRCLSLAVAFRDDPAHYTRPYIYIYIYTYKNTKSVVPSKSGTCFSIATARSSMSAHWAVVNLFILEYVGQSSNTSVSKKKSCRSSAKLNEHYYCGGRGQFLMYRQ